MHQLHQLHGQFIFVKTCSDKESSDGFIFEDFKYGGAEDWDKAVSLEPLACSTQWKINLVVTKDWVHGQFMFVKTCPDKESLDGFIKANQKKTELSMGKRPKLTLQIISSLWSCVPGTGANFSILWLHMCCLKNTYRKSKILHPSSVEFGYNCSRIRPGSGSSLISWIRPRMRFVRFPLPMRNAPSSSQSVFHQERASCTGDLYTHELKTCNVELTCCWLPGSSGRAATPPPTTRSSHSGSVEWHWCRPWAFEIMSAKYLCRFITI